MAGAILPALPAILGAVGGLFGGRGQEINPQPLPPLFPQGQQAFGDWLFSGFFQKPGGGFDLFRLQNPISIPGGQQMMQDIPGLQMSNLGNRFDIQGFPLFPSMSQTRLPEVFGNWQPWDAGTQYLADYLYNKNPIGTPDPRLAQAMQWGGFGGPGHQSMNLLREYGAPSQAGQYVANMAQFGVPSEGIGNLMMPFARGQRTTYAPPPISTARRRRK